MTNCPTHGQSLGDQCLSCYRDYAAKVWPVHARNHRMTRPNDPASFHHNERWGELADLTPSEPIVHTALTSVEGTQANQT